MLIILNGTHVVLKAQVKNFTRQIIFIILDVSLWCSVRMHLTVTMLDYFYQFLLNSKSHVLCMDCRII